MNHGARLVKPAEATVSIRCRVRGPVGDDVRVLLRQLGSPLLGGPQLVSIRVDFGVQETLRVIHIGSAASRRLLGEDCQQRLDDVLRRVGILVAIRQGQQIQRHRCDRNIARQPLIQRLFLLGVGNSDVQIGQPDELLQVRPAQERPLHKIELAGRICIRGQAPQQRRQQGIGIEIDPRR